MPDRALAKDYGLASNSYGVEWLVQRIEERGGSWLVVLLHPCNIETALLWPRSTKERVMWKDTWELKLLVPL